MAEQDVPSSERAPVDDGGLLTPQEVAALRALRKLRELSDELIREAQHINRPKEFLRRFPPPAPRGAN